MTPFMTISETTIRNILARTSGFLRTVASHSLQPYRGCSFGNALCGVGCYVQHNQHLLAGRPWGSFLEVRTNAAESYRENHRRERDWARRHDPQVGFTIFLSSATEPFLPQESKYGVTRSVLEAMLDQPPDRLILQTHSHRVADHVELCRELATRCELRIHVSIETDRDRIADLPPHASPIDRRFEACEILREAGIRTVVTVSPLLPIADPESFFRRIADVADAVVIDHFIQGDGSALGQRTLRTDLPAAMAVVDPRSVQLTYRDAMVDVARRFLPGRVGINIDGFAGRYV